MPNPINPLMQIIENAYKAGLRAYHGSPYDFDEFKTEAIGSGEGSQAYGQGLYFAESEDVARGYRDSLTKLRKDGTTPVPEDSIANSYEQEYGLSRYEDFNNTTLDDVIETISDDAVETSADVNGNVRYEFSDGSGYLITQDGKVIPSGEVSGRMYEVNIDADPDELLDWDAPLSEQKALLKKLDDAYGDHEIVLQQLGLDLKYENPTGMNLADALNMRRGFPEGPPKLLEDAGIKGVKYADAFTRHKPKDKRSNNYVIFDPKIISIARKYGVSVPVAYMMMQSEESEAAMLDPALRVLRLGADLAQNAPAQFNRGVRNMAKRVALNANEKAAITRDIEPTGLSTADSGLAMNVARDWKKRHPSADWAQPKITGASVNKDNKIQLKFETMPYAYNIDPRTGKAVEAGSAQYNKMVNGVADEIIDYFNRAAEDPNDLAARNVINNAGWYKNVERRLRNEYGSFSEMMGDVLGATSPNTPVATNFRFSKDILDGFARGEFDELMNGFADALDARYALEDQADAYLKAQRQAGRKVKDIKADPTYSGLIDESKRIGQELRDQRNIIRQRNGKQFGINSYNAMVALADRFRVRRPGSAPKAKNFAGNLVGDSREATIDVWSARNLRRHSGRKPIPSSAEQGVTGEIVDPENFTSNLEFGFGQDVIRDATDKINEFIGSNHPLYPLDPRDVQALQWFAEKDLWTRNGWTSKAGEGGSFEQMLDADPVESMFLGLSREQSMETQGRNFVPTAGQMIESATNILRPANTDPDVVTYKGLPTSGAYLGSPETALDIDIVTRQDFIPAETLDLAAVQAAEDAQDSWFVARRIKDSLGAAKPEMFTVGSEIFFDGAKASDSDLIQDISDFLINNDIPAYTMIVDPRDANSVIGLRVLDIPQFSGDSAKYARMSTKEYEDTVKERYGKLEDLGRNLEEEFDQVKSSTPAYFDVNVKSLSDTQEYLEQYGTNARDPDALRQEFYGFKPAQERFRQWEGSSQPFYRKYKAPTVKGRKETALGLGGLGFIGGSAQAEEKPKGVASLQDYGSYGPTAQDFVEAANLDMGRLEIARPPRKTPFSELTGLDQYQVGQAIKRLPQNLPPHLAWLAPGEALGDYMMKGAYGDEQGLLDALFAGLDIFAVPGEPAAIRSAYRKLNQKAADELAKDRKLEDYLRSIDIFSE
jgi:hypothetical protein